MEEGEAMAFSIVQALIEWLPGEIGAPAHDAAPDPRPRKFATIERVGGESGVGIDRPVLAVQLWAPTAAEAEELALECRDALNLRAASIPRVHGAHASSPVSFPDPDSRSARYQITVRATTQ